MASVLGIHGLSARFVEAVTTGQGKWRAKVLVKTAAGAPIADISERVLGGNVHVDETAEIRRTLTNLTIDGKKDIIPPQQLTSNAMSYEEMLHPAKGNELWVYRGVQYSDDPTDAEFAGLGVFRPSKPVIQDSGTTVSFGLAGNDRASVVAGIDWLAPYTVPQGGSLTGALQAAINNRIGSIYPGLRYNFTSDEYTSTFQFPLTTFGPTPSSQGDPMQDFITFAGQAGAELFFDIIGEPVLRQILNPGIAVVTDPVHFIEGENCTFDDITRTIDETTAKNGVRLFCNGTGAAGPFTVSVWDANSSSPSFYKGPWGPRPYKMTTTAIPFGADTYDAAYVKAFHMASQQLQLILGSMNSITLTCVPNPALQEGDICHVVRSRVKVDDDFVISIMDIPLDPLSKQTITLRPKALVA